MDFTPTQIFVGAVVAAIALIGGGAVTLAALFYTLDRLRAGEGVAAPPATEQPVDPALRARRRAAYHSGVVVLLGLAVLTAVEFLLTQVGVSVVTLFIVALLKAALILQYFMHVASLWIGEGSH